MTRVVWAAKEPKATIERAAHRPQQRLAHAEVVLDEVALGLAALGEQHLARAGEPDLAPVELEHLVVVAVHEPTVPIRPT